MTRRAWLAHGLVAALLIVSGSLAVSSMRLDSATDDEPAHIAAGYLKVTQGYFDFYTEQPPLINTLEALPLASGKFKLPEGWDAPGANPWRTGHRFLFESGNDANEILFRARLPIVGLFLLLSLLVYGWAFALTQRREAALLACALCAFCPNLMAHARLATVDLGAALFCALGAFGFLRFLRAPGAARAVAAGVGLGLAALTKVSVLMLLPWCALVLALHVFCDRAWRARFGRTLLPQILVLQLAGLVTVEAWYLVEMSAASMQSISPQLAATWWGRLEIPLLAHARHVATVLRLVSEPYPNPGYLLGAISHDGFWNYYLVAMLVKTPVTSLLLIGGALAGLFLPSLRRASGAGWGLEVWAMLLFVVFFVGAASASKLDLGLRYVLPVYPFLYVLVAVVAARAVAAAGRARNVLIGGMALLGCGSVAAGVAAYPSYIAYFNELVPSRNADRYLIDSNLDWGQDLRRLARWADENHVAAVHVVYFGGGDPAYDLGAKARVMTTCEAPEPGYYAISRHLYRMGFFAKGTERDCELHLRGARLVTTIDGSILVFEVPGGLR